MAVDSAAQSHVEQAQQTGEQILKDLNAAIAEQANHHQESMSAMRPQKHEFLDLVKKTQNMTVENMRKHVETYLGLRGELERKAHEQTS